MKVPHKIGLLVLALGISAIANSKDIAVTAKADFRDASIIPSKIRSECTDLGSSLAQSTKKYLEEAGWQVALGENAEIQKSGNAIKLEILNAVSAGNAFVGHHKSVTIAATLYKDGKLVDTYTATRDSGGGFAGGFKGSCPVLYRCTTTLGSDIAKWLNAKY